MLLSQARLDRRAAHLMRRLGTLAESLTVTTPAGTHTVQGWVRQYHLNEIDTYVIRREDRQLLLPHAAVSWAMRTDDQVTRADSSLWQVLYVDEGRLPALVMAQLRRVG